MMAQRQSPSNEPTDAQAFEGWTTYQRWLVAQLARVQPAPGAGTERDDLIPLSQVPLEARARRRAVREGKLPVARIGRKLYVRRSAVVGLVPATAEAARSAPTQDPRAAATQAYQRSRGGR